ncbi:MAG: hypothetical protein AB8B55_04845 [Mariniblastus sp.]
MLDLKSTFKLTFLLVGTVLLTGSAFGQQTPSKRYQPVRSSDIQNQAVQQRFEQARPSTHMPPQQMQKLRPKFRASGQQNTQQAYGGVQHQFGDSPTVGQNPTRLNDARRNFQAPAVNSQMVRGQIQQASFEVDQDGNPVVPAILSGGIAQQPAAQPQTSQQLKPSFQAPTQFQAPKSQAPVVDEVTNKSPADFAAAMKQTRVRGPRIAPNELSSHQDGLSAQMAELRKRAEAKAKAEADRLAAQVAAEQREIQRLAAEKAEAERLAAEKMANAKAEAERVEAQRIAMEQAAEKAAQMEMEAERLEMERLAAERMAAEKLAEERLAAERAAAQRLAVEQAEADRLEAEQAEAARLAAAKLAAEKAANEISASDFIGQITGKQSNVSAPAPTQDTYTAQRLVAQDNSVRPDATPETEMPAVMQLTTDPEPQPVRDNQVRPVSSETDAPAAATIKLSSPAIQVDTYGPETVGVNKPANYQVVVRNTSETKAERILVGINMPQWVDIENVNLTSGGKEVTDGQNQARLVWSIDQIPANSTQTITITAVPRKAEMFDVGVEWTLVPRVGKTNITVTEPRLEMSISGPREVLFGESAIYHVTLRNPGTGPAEKVFVMLPEALGGARKPLDGPIPAGDETNFQVELLARTAGDLNLSATAVADGGLKVTSERALTVRRANLELSLEGPGLKYSGSIGQYTVTIKNSGDATANEIVTAVALPTGVKYLGGVDSVKLIEGGMRWAVGSLEPNQTRTFKINCQLDTSGDLQLEVGARGKGDLAASSACLTTVETVADLVLTVADPKGPLPTGEKVPYEIKVVNRGTKSAQGVNLVMQFSEGIEPKDATGLEHRIVPGQVLFSPIAKIDPGQEMRFMINAEAMKGGTHIFRAQLTCQDSDAREIAEGTTRFFGEAVTRSTPAPAEANTANAGASDSGFGSNDFGGFKR